MVIMVVSESCKKTQTILYMLHGLFLHVPKIMRERKSEQNMENNQLYRHVSIKSNCSLGFCTTSTWHSCWMMGSAGAGSGEDLKDNSFATASFFASDNSC